MSTRGAIVKLTSKEGEPITFQGVFHHWDSYPSGLGATLYKIRNGHFKGDTKAMLKILLAHVWFTMVEADFSIPIGYIENAPVFGGTTKKEIKAYEFYRKTPKCYCHGDRHEKKTYVTEKDASDIGCEYVYAFTKDGKKMIILSSYCKDGRKMIGAFGCGDPNAIWKSIAEIDLDGKEPDWEKI